jgi:hypothetical protein
MPVWETPPETEDAKALNQLKKLKKGNRIK